MVEDLIKKLTGKNKQDFEAAACHLVNTADVEMFKALVAKDDFLLISLSKMFPTGLQTLLMKPITKIFFRFCKYIRPHTRK